MTKLITSQRDREEAFILLKAAIQATILHGISPADRQKIFQHIEWMERTLTDFNIDARLESNVFQTKLTLTYHHGAGKGNTDG